MAKTKTDMMIEALINLNQSMQTQGEVLAKIVEKLDEKPLPPTINQDSYIDKMENTTRAMPKGIVGYKLLLGIKDTTGYVSYDYQAYQHLTFSTLDELKAFVTENKIQDYIYNTIHQ